MQQATSLFESSLIFSLHHRACGRTIICFTGLFFSSKYGLAQPLGCKFWNSVAHGHFGYWWRSQFSCLASNEFKLRVSIIFDFATSTRSGHEPFRGRNLYN